MSNLLAHCDYLVSTSAAPCEHPALGSRSAVSSRVDAAAFIDDELSFAVTPPSTRSRRLAQSRLAQSRLAQSRLA